MTKRIDSVLVASAALGAMTGLRSMSAATLLARELAARKGIAPQGSLAGLIASPTASRLLTVLAGGEMLADKTPVVPDRTTPGPLIGRAVIGSLVAAAVAASLHRAVLLPAITGGASAVAATLAAFHLRRFAAERLGIPDPVLGAIEDGIVLGAGKRIVSSLRHG